MLNDDVMAVIQSYAGITSLDVANAVRELKREGVVVEPFKMRDLGKVCFMIQYKFEKKECNKEWLTPGLLKISFDYDGLVHERSFYLLAFKVMGYHYQLNVVMNCSCLPFILPFTIAGKRLSQFKWCKMLKQIYEKETGNYCRLMDLRNSKVRQTKIELRVMRPLF